MKLQEEYNYFKENKEVLQENYCGKFVAIQGHDVIGAGDEKVDLVRKMSAKGYTIGEFLVHRITEDRDPVRKYHSRID